MNKKIAAFIAKLILLLIAILFMNIIWNSWYIPDLFRKPVDYNVTDPSSDEIFAHKKKFNHVLSPKIDRLINKGNPEKTLELIDSIMPEYHGESLLHLKKGLALIMIDSLEDAISSFDEIFRINSPSKFSMIYRRSLHYKYECLVTLEKYDESLEVLEYLWEVNPDYKIDIAYVYELKKDYKNSIKYYKLILNDYQQSDSLGFMIEIKDLKERIKELEKKVN